MKYICECGRTFNSAQRFGGHCTQCSSHLQAIGKYESSKHHPKCKEESKRKLEAANKLKWESEQHVCEKCGIVMTNKYGSGRFCSRKCANSHIKSEESKKKTSNTIKCNYENLRLTGQNVKAQNRLTYNSHPNKCVICGKELSYENRFSKTCGKVCGRKLQSSIMVDMCAKKGLHRTVPRRYKYGTYRNIPCDSSWELALVVYCTEVLNISVERNKDSFKYTYNDESHNYFPDFIINNTYIEIKNYWTERVEAKLKHFPSDKKYRILYYDDIKYCIQYCEKTYGKDFWVKLYDPTLPNCMTVDIN